MKTANSLFLLFLTVSALLASTNTVQAVEIVKSIPFDGLPVMAYDSYKGAIWVTTYYSYVPGFGMPPIPQSAPTNTVSAISDRNGAVLANVTVGQNPNGIAYDSALHEIYVTTPRTVFVISDMSNSVVATIDVNSTYRGLSNIVYDSGKGEMFVSSNQYGGVLVISCRTKQIVATIPLGDPPPSRLIYDSGKGEIYVYRQSFTGENPIRFLSVISDATNSVIATVPLDSGMGSAGAYDAATGEIYLPGNRSVLVISDKTHTVIDSIPLEYNPICVAYDPVKSVLFAGAAFNTTYIISDKTRSVIETIPLSSVFMVYDTGKNLMLAMGNSSIQFVSDASLPSLSPTSTIPEFPWLAVMPLLFALLLVALKLRHPCQRDTAGNQRTTC